MNSQIVRLLFILSTVLLSSCATLFSRKTVYVSCKDEKASVYVNDIYTSEYAGATIRKHAPCIVTTTRSGYKTKSTVVQPKQFDPVVLVTAIPAAMVFFANGANATGDFVTYGVIAGLDYWIAGKMHKRRFEVDGMDKLPTSQFEDIYVRMRTELDSLRYENVKVVFCRNYDEWLKRDRVFTSMREDFLDEPPYWLDQTLDDLGYMNFQSDIINNYDKNLSVDVKVLDAQEFRVKNFGTSMKLNVRYTFSDLYGNALSFVDVQSESALFSSGYFYSEYQSSLAMRDALINGLSDALKSDEFTALYNRTREAFNNAYLKGDATNVKAPIESRPDFQNMANAQITIDGDGYHGSGCLISPDGLAITSHRVVGTKKEVEVIFSNGARKKAKVIKRDPVSNIVLLSSDTTGVSSLKLSKGTSGRTGESVYCVGSPVNKALSQSISSGIVSGYRQQNGVVFIQTDAKVSNGNNGSPLIDQNGYVVGIVNEKYLGIALEGLSFAVSAEDIIKGLNLNTEY